jgi:hypothetical protein
MGCWAFVFAFSIALNPTMYTVFAGKPTQAEGPMRTTLLIAALLLTPLAKAQDTEWCLPAFSTIINNPGPQKSAPFTAVVKETFDQKLADGNAIHGTVRYRIARDASGRIMTEMPTYCYTGGGGRRHQAYRVNVYDRTTNTNETWQLSDGQPKIATIRTVAAQPPSPAELATVRANPQTRPVTLPHRQPEQLGTREFQGIPTTGTRRTQTIPAGEEGNALRLVIVTESWMSRDLNLSMMSISDDPRRGRTTAEIEELHRGDPDPALFSPPEGYIIKDQNPPVSPLPLPPQ